MTWIDPRNIVFPEPIEFPHALAVLLGAAYLYAAVYSGRVLSRLALADFPHSPWLIAAFWVSGLLWPVFVVFLVVGRLRRPTGAVSFGRTSIPTRRSR